ncbi:MAG: tRNA glutamyl-Q(34) synthetase GluQRS [Rhodospirillaceae bacterium]
MTVVSRFAPSPTGRLHLGHAFSALQAWGAAQENPAARFLLRIEDIDRGRCREPFVDGIYEDLAWLGLHWEQPVLRQSTRLAAYGEALADLNQRGLLYPCFCTRQEIRHAVQKAGLEDVAGEGPPYPGTCRGLSPAEQAERKAAGQPFAVRLDMARAVAAVDASSLIWTDRQAGMRQADPGRFGDVVLARKDVPTSYHLAVVVDDAFQGVTTVVRGQDLFAATDIHRLLQALLGLPVPDYWHHGLIRDDGGTRLAKSRGSQSLADLRAAGWTQEDAFKALDVAPEFRAKLGQ